MEYFVSSFVERWELAGYEENIPSKIASRAMAIAKDIERAALSHQTRSRLYNLGSDQFVWAVLSTAMMGCISRLDGLRAHDIQWTEKEVEMVRYIFMEWWASREISVPIPGGDDPRINLDRYLGYTQSRGLAQWLRVVDPVRHISTVGPREELPPPILRAQSMFSHSHCVAIYETEVARSRAGEAAQRHFVKIEGEPRTSTKSVLYSRWNR